MDKFTFTYTNLQPVRLGGEKRKKKKELEIHTSWRVTSCNTPD